MKEMTTEEHMRLRGMGVVLHCWSCCGVEKLTVVVCGLTPCLSGAGC